LSQEIRQTIKNHLYDLKTVEEVWDIPFHQLSDRLWLQYRVYN